jgi:CheY-like chemotaxis protein
MWQTQLESTYASIGENADVKLILVVAEDRPLRRSRVGLLEHENYVVESVESDDEAMKLLLTRRFDLVLLGRNSDLQKTGIDQRIREQYPDLLTLKIETAGQRHTQYPSRVTDSAPEHVIKALREMLDEDVDLVPVKLPIRSRGATPSS